MAIAAGGFALIVRQWRRGNGSSDFAIGALPFALTLVTVPLSIGAWQMGEVFRELGENPMMGPIDAAARFAALGHEARAALLLCAALLTSAAALQFVAARRGGRLSAAPPSQPGVQDRDWRAWFPILSVLLLGPVMMLGRMARGIPALILGPMLGPAVGEAVAADAMVALGAVGDASLLISSRVQTAVIVGAITTMTLIAAGIINMRALRAYRPARNTPLAWFVLGGVVMFLAWSAMALTADIQMFEEALK
jgi:hypothetical protein